MQVSTFVGLLLGVLVVGYAAGNILADLYDPTMLLLVVGGGIAATLVSDGIRPMLGALGVARHIFAASEDDQPKGLVERVLTYAQTARRDGVLSLEKPMDSEPNSFLGTGIQLVVDGTEPSLIMDILKTELNFSAERHANDERLLERLGRNGALFSVVGGLLILMQGGSMVAVGLPLLYGVLLYALVGGAFARKLARHYAKERLLCRMAIEGVMAIQAGDNPRIIQYKLAVFVAPKDRPMGNELPEPLPRSAPATPDITSEDIENYVEQGHERMITAVQEAIDQSDRDREECKAASAFLNRAERGELGTIALLITLGPELRQIAMEALQRPAEPQTALINSAMLEDGVLRHELDFESLSQLEDRQIQMLLREIDQRDAIVALKGASVVVRDKILANMEERVQDFITEELSFTHCVPHDVLNAQSRIVLELHRILADSEKE